MTPVGDGVFARGIQYGEAGYGSREFHLFYDLRGANEDCLIPGSQRNGSSLISTDCSINLDKQLGGSPLTFVPNY